MARPADPHARSSLIAAARQEFVKSGIVKARIEDITQKCGLSKGAFYLHFESKEALFRELVSGLQVEVDRMRDSRQQAYLELIAQAGQPRGAGRQRFLDQMAEIDAREDRHLLETLWEWRDVADVLLRGSQGTEFEGVMWNILDEQMERVQVQLVQLERAGLVRHDVPADVVGMMIVGTYLMVARRLTSLKTRPDFEKWVRGLQGCIASGISTPQRLPSSSSPRRPVARRVARTSPRKKKSS